MLDNIASLLESWAGQLPKLTRRLARFEPVGALSAVAALQLLPVNAGRSLRLEVLACTAAAAAKRPGRATINPQLLNEICNSGPLAQGYMVAGEDPVENPFTETISFYGGSYLVLPGTFEEATFVLRQFMKAIFLERDSFTNSEFVTAANKIISAVLTLSNRIVTSANLGRGEDPRSIPGGDVVIPDAAQLDQLQRVVCFSVDELTRLLAERDLSLATLERFISDPSNINIGDLNNGKNPLLARPILRIGDQFILTIPGALISATVDVLVALANEFGVATYLASRFGAALWQTVDQSLRFMKNEPVLGTLPAITGLVNAHDGLFHLDTDKALYVLLVYDPLLNYDPDLPANHWPEECENIVQQRLSYIENLLFSLEKPPNCRIQ